MDPYAISDNVPLCRLAKNKPTVNNKNARFYDNTQLGY